METTKKDLIQNLETILAHSCVSDVENVAEEIYQLMKRAGTVKEVTEPFTGRLIHLYEEN